MYIYTHTHTQWVKNVWVINRCKLNYSDNIAINGWQQYNNNNVCLPLCGNNNIIIIIIIIIIINQAFTLI